MIIGYSRESVRYLAAFVATSLLALVLAGPALAVTPTDSQYCDGLGSGAGAGSSCSGTEAAGDGGAANPSSGAAAESAASEASGGSSVAGLPFTGTDLVALAAVSASLILGGIALSRLSTAPRS